MRKLLIAVLIAVVKDTSLKTIDGDRRTEAVSVEKPKTPVGVSVETLDIRAVSVETLDIRAVSVETLDIRAVPVETLDIRAVSVETLDIKEVSVETLDLNRCR